MDRRGRVRSTWDGLSGSVACHVLENVVRVITSIFFQGRHILVSANASAKVSRSYGYLCSHMILSPAFKVADLQLLRSGPAVQPS